MSHTPPDRRTDDPGASPRAPHAASRARTSPSLSHEAQAARILESITDAFFALDCDWRLEYVNRHAEELLGRGRDEMIGRQLWELFPDAVGTEFERQYRRAVSEGVAVTFEAYFAPHKRWYAAKAYPTDAGLTVYFQDITKAKQAEEEREYILATARCLLWSAEVSAAEDGRFLSWQTSFPDMEAAQRFLPIARKPDQPFYKAWYEARLREDTDRCNRVGESALLEGRDYDQEFRVRLADGTVRWVRENIKVQVVEPGLHWRLVGVCTDVTAQRETDAALRQSEQRFRALSEALPQLVWSTDAAGSLDYVNERWLLFTGQTREQARGGGGFDALHPEDRPIARMRWQAAVETGGLYEMEYRLRRADGEYCWFLARGLPLRDSDGEITRWFGTCTDIDEQMQAHAQIEDLNTRLQRAMSETHHRVKNNLQVIAALIDMQTAEHTQHVPTWEVRGLSQHIRGLAAIHDLLTAQSQAGGGAESLSARSAIAKLLPMLQSTMTGRRIHAELDEARILTRQGTAIALVVNELVSNAVKHGAGDIGVRLHVEGEQARLEVEDDGPGFPEGFDPATAANTGLDLVLNLASWDLGGQARLENRREGGARVAITFPLQAAPGTD